MIHSGLTTDIHNNLFFKLSVENLNSQQRKTSYSTFCLAQSHVLRWCESKWLQWSHFYLQLKAFTTWCNGFVLASGSKNAAPSRIQTLAPLLPNAFKTPNITAPRRLDFRPRYRRHYVGLAPLLRSNYSCFPLAISSKGLRRLDFGPEYRRQYVGRAPLLQSTAVSYLLLVVKVLRRLELRRQ